MPLWAQVPGTDPNAIPAIALRRWFAGLTLSSPESAPSRFGLSAWLLALGALLLLALVVQGPGRALKQLLDVPGHLAVARAATRRLRRATWLVAIVLGAAVVAWTTWQAIGHAAPENLDSLAILLKNKTPGEIAQEQAALTALTPLRDLTGLGDSLVLLLTAGVLVFKLSADRWGGGPARAWSPSASNAAQAPIELPPWTTVAWGAAWLYLLYRLAGYLMPPPDEPPGGCLVLEALVVPLLMLAADALLFGWILQELGRASTAPPEGADSLDLDGAVRLWPRALVACLVAIPARYVATAAFLAWPYVQPWAGPAIQSAAYALLRGRGLIGLQAVSLVLLPLVGVAAWPGLSLRGGTFRLIRTQGGRLVAVIAGAGLAAGVLSAIAYVAVLALPPQPWVLAAADSYAHYVSLPVGLLLLATLVDLAGTLVQAPAPADPAADQMSEASESACPWWPRPLRILRPAADR